MPNSLWNNNFQNLRGLFYLVTPRETTFDSLESIPDFVSDAIPFFLLFIIIEILIIYHRKDKYTKIDWSDSISSISAGILSQLQLIFVKSFEIVSYVWVHRNYKIVTLSQHSTLVWLCGMLSVDFGYYWVHRASHEISLFWSGHQVHHSSQRYNLSTALRQGMFQKYYSWLFYLPAAFFIPPEIFIVHLQFNLLYQFWIHTEVIGTLGPLEWILNTPSHHRVHHGRNKYCIDKNYGGFLIIFDRIFGTFQKEKQKVVYGHVTPIETWNPIEIQIVYLRHMLEKFSRMNNIKCKLKSIFYGPGWNINSQRLGSPEDILEPENPVRYFHRNISTLTFSYCVFNFIFANFTFYLLTSFKIYFKMSHLILGTLAIVFTLVQIGRLLEGRKIFWSECFRIITVVGIASKFACL